MPAAAPPDPYGGDPHGRDPDGDDRYDFDLSGRDPYGQVRILCMGTATHDGELRARSCPRWRRSIAGSGTRRGFDLIGFVAGGNPVVDPATGRFRRTAARSYPRVRQLAGRGGFRAMGHRPGAAGDTRSTRGKSGIRGAGLRRVGAGDRRLGRRAVGEVRWRMGPAAVLVPNTAEAWSEALSWLIRDAACAPPPRGRGRGGGFGPPAFWAFQDRRPVVDGGGRPHSRHGAAAAVASGASTIERDATAIA